MPKTGSSCRISPRPEGYLDNVLPRSAPSERNPKIYSPESASGNASKDCPESTLRGFYLAQFEGCFPGALSGALRGLFLEVLFGCDGGDFFKRRLAKHEKEE